MPGLGPTGGGVLGVMTGFDPGGGNGGGLGEPVESD